jgi:hypothetical protein
MAEFRAPTVEETIRGWLVFTSDAGRFWASRAVPFDELAEDAGAHRTVDGDDLPQLCMNIAAQEALASMAELL